MCGAVKFEFHTAPIWIGYCHCYSCRRNTGAPVTAFVGVAATEFKLCRGSLTKYSSSPGVVRSFCATCGTPLTYAAERFPGEVHIYISVLDEPERFVPEFHVFTEEQISWFQVADRLPRHLGTTSESQGNDEKFLDVP